MNEIRYALRTLIKSPVFFAVAVLSLALGIGANTAVFTLVDQVLIGMMPVYQPERIVQLRSVGEHYGSNTGMNALSYPMYKEFSEQNPVLDGMLCRARDSFAIAYNGRGERAAGELISGTFFPVFGLRPALGRLIGPNDDKVGAAAPVAVLGYDYWQNRFAGDPAVVGKELVVNGHKLTIVGVAPAGFDGAETLFATQIYAPVAMASLLTTENKPFENRRRKWLQVFGRLKPGVEIEQAKAALQPIFHRMLEYEVQQPAFAQASAHARERFLAMQIDVMPGGGGQNVVKKFLAAPLWAMMAMVGLVLLIACANVANLLIARATARQKEIAVRLALGASRMRIVRQLFIESVVVALSGGLLGLMMTPYLMRAVASLFPSMDPPIRIFMTPNFRVLLFNLAVSLGTAVVFGLAPALQTTKPDLAPTLKEQAGAVAGGHTAWRKVLVAAQVSLSLLLLIGAGLFVRSLQNLQKVSPGFEVANLLTFHVDAKRGGYDLPQARQFYRELQQKLEGTAGIQSAALAVVPLLAFNNWDNTVTVEGYTAKTGEDMDPKVNYISPAFFETMKIPVLAGREFRDADGVDAPKVVIVNQRFAHHYFGDRNPIGRHIGMGGDPGTKTDIEIVGVVRDSKYDKIRDETPRQVFFPYQQNRWASDMTVYVRTNLSSGQMFPALRELVRGMNPNLPLYQMKTADHQRGDSLSIERFAASLSASFGVLATVLAGIGLYGVMAFLVTRRTREIGLRIALGAETGSVIWIVMREVLMLTGAGIAVGIPAALLLTRYLGSQLYELTSYDPLTIGVATLTILGMSLLSGYIPALRATRVDPVRALRYE